MIINLTRSERRVGFLLLFLWPRAQPEASMRQTIEPLERSSLSLSLHTRSRNGRFASRKEEGRKESLCAVNFRRRCVTLSSLKSPTLHTPFSPPSFATCQIAQ